MSRLIILYLALTVSVAFDQMQGTFYYRRFSFSSVEMILPDYLSTLVKYIGVIAIMWVTYFQETEYPNQMKIAAWLTTGFGIDFLIECNHCWISIGDYSLGYRTAVFIIFGIVIAQTYYTKWRSSS